MQVNLVRNIVLAFAFAILRFFNQDKFTFKHLRVHVSPEALFKKRISRFKLQKEGIERLKHVTFQAKSVIMGLYLQV